MKIVVGMSGGVDSAVAAYLLKHAGHDVTGVFMNNWEEKDELGVCASERDFADVRAVCDIIGIPYYSVNFAKEYMERVFAHFLEELKRGRTPNPDVLCNREIKFSAFLDFAEKIGADKIATGHFAGVEERNGEYKLTMARDANKDQTYFLYMLTQRALSKTVFPLTDMTKQEVRRIAYGAGLPVFNKKDSTGVCFIGERNFKRFLSGYLPAQPGDIVDTEGNVLGAHDGLMYYTIGQRRGLGIGGGGTGERWFVVKKDIAHNRLVVMQGADSPLLYSNMAIGSSPHWISGHAPVPNDTPYECMVRLRHRSPLAKAVIRVLNGRVGIRFFDKQRAVTPGQAAVFYVNDECLGGVTLD